MERWHGRVALVTGANAGIGAAIAKILVNHGMIVLGCDVNTGNIEATADQLITSKGGSLHAMCCDLRKEDDIIAMFIEIKSRHGGVDVLVNNAGLVVPEDGILYGQTDGWREMVDVNVMASAICAREAVKPMRDKNVDDGHILQMCSNLGYKIPPHLPELHWYSATKWMVRAIIDCLRMELRQEKSRIKVSNINPGPVNTDFIRKLYGEEKGAAFLKEHETLSAETVADVLISVLGTPEGVEIESILVEPTEK